MALLRGFSEFLVTETHTHTHTHTGPITLPLRKRGVITGLARLALIDYIVYVHVSVLLCVLHKRWEGGEFFQLRNS